MGNQRDRTDIEAALQKKGFLKENKDHEYYTYYDNNRKTAIFTKLSFGSDYKTYGQSLLGKMSKQLKLSNKELLDLIDCDLSGEKYLEILKNKKIL